MLDHLQQDERAISHLLFICAGSSDLKFLTDSVLYKDL